MVHLLQSFQSLCIDYWYETQYICVGVSRPGVSGPTSENVAACPSPDGSARGRARRGEEGVRDVGIPRPSCSRPAPRSGALAVGGYKRSAREGASGLTRAPVPSSSPRGPTLSKRALVLPFIGVRRGSRCIMGV
jgi:hypothetical protein